MNQNLFLGGFFLSYLIISALGAWVILFLGKNRFAKIQNINYLNSFSICLASMVVWALVWSVIQKMNFFEHETLYIFLIRTFIVSLISISLGKFIWKCTWKESMKSNIAWIIVCSIYWVIINVMF
jgi:hypothetical protein